MKVKIYSLEAQPICHSVTSTVNRCVREVFGGASQASNGPAESDCLDDYDPPTDMSVDVTTDGEASMLQQGGVTPQSSTKWAAMAQQRQAANTPMPNYSAWSTPDILVILQNHITWLKPLNKSYELVNEACLS